MNAITPTRQQTDIWEVKQFNLADGEPVERGAGYVNGHEVQVLIYDGDTSAVIVCIDAHAEQMPLINVNEYIQEQTR